MVELQYSGVMYFTHAGCDLYIGLSVHFFAFNHIMRTYLELMFCCIKIDSLQ